MLILGLDFETTGLDATENRVIEIGAVVWDTDRRRPVQLFSELIKPEPHIQLPPEITEVTGITQEDIDRFGEDGVAAFSRLQDLVSQCDYVVAHNVSFDRSFYENELMRCGFVADPSKPWIDTLYDLPFSNRVSSRKLTHVAADYGVFNPYSHRALFDVITMLQLLSQFDFDEVLVRQKSPNVEVVSHVTYDEREEAKKMGFRWDAGRRIWVKSMKACDANPGVFPFDISVHELN
ncbi:MAG: 3'-5' exonuclease [Pseudobdellovibrionaceae bacterium]|nr:3'-5' exonuclease [Bdellovibrionales bacterium]USN48418.1 MAG: 3'-5' exonuclease [Pseudobdellovibrionaceae bacterium]